MRIPSRKYQFLILADAVKNKGNIWHWLDTPSWRKETSNILSTWKQVQPS